MATHDLKRTLYSILLAILVAGAVAVAALAYAVSQAGYWLEAPGRQPAPVDAIIVLGGDDGERSLRALELYRGGDRKSVV